MRPFCIATIGAILGIIMGLYFSSIVLFISLLSFSIIIFFLFKNYRKTIFIFIISFSIFAVYTHLLEENSNCKMSKYGEKEVQIKAIVVSDATNKEYKDVYNIKILEIKVAEQTQKDKNFHLLLNLKKSKKEHLQLNYGDEIIVTSNYEIPSTNRNKGGFNYQQYLKIKKISGIITVKPNDIKKIGENKNSYIATWIYQFKQKLINDISKVLPKETVALCTGLLLGEKENISEEVQENFRKSNLSHMLAISGAHVSYFILGLTFLVIHLKIHKRWSKIFLILFLIFFMILVGFTPSVTRACIMSILTLLADIFFRKSDVYQNLAISSFIILFCNPYSLLDIGFQLSFGGTIGIVCFHKKMMNIVEAKRLRRMINKKVKTNQEEQKLGNIKPKGIQKQQKTNKEKLQINKRQYQMVKDITNKIIQYIKQMLIVSFSANLAILPIMMYHFNTFSLTFLLSNLLASPILGIALILSLLLAILFLILPPIAQIVSLFLHPILQLLIQIANFSAKLPFSQILVPTPHLISIFGYYTLVLLFFYKDKLFSKIKKMQKYKNIIIFLLIFLIISQTIARTIPTNQLQINFIDVGQGDSLLVETSSRKTILVDGGGSETGSFDVGEKTLLPYLLDKGILSLDYLLFSHFDTDHCQGLFTILEKLKVKNVIISKQGKDSQNFQTFLNLVQKRKVNVIVVKAGDKIKIDNKTNLDILFPTNNFISSNVLNNNSIVAKLNWKGTTENQEFSILLTGDIEEIAEKKIIELYQNTNQLQSNILKVAHHGSKSSSIQGFVELVKPQIALIGVGEKNTFGHPNTGVLERLEQMRK